MADQQNTEIQMASQSDLAEKLVDEEEDEQKGASKMPAPLDTKSANSNSNKKTKVDEEDDDDDDDDNKKRGGGGGGDDDDDDEDDDGKTADSGAPSKGAIVAAVLKDNVDKCDAICYLLFLCVFIAMAVLGRTASDYNYTQTQSIRQKITEQDVFTPWNDVGEKSFAEIGNIQEIYIYCQEVLIPVIFNEDYNNGTEITDPLKKYYVNSNARVLGGIRFKQYRVSQETCELEPSTFPLCYNDDQEETGTFVGNGQWQVSDNINDTRWYEDYIITSYQSSDDLADQSWRGKFGTYSGGGYIVDFPLNMTKDGAIELLNAMADAEWIDAGTRGLFIDFNTFNPSTVLHTVARLALEMPTGGVFPISEIKTWKFYRYEADGGTALAVLHVFFLIFVAGYTIHMGFEMYQDGVCACICKNQGKKLCGYWGKSKWRWLDVINIIIFYCLIGVFVSNDGYMDDEIDLTDIWQYQSYRSLQYLFLAEVYLQALAGFLLFLKLFKYLGVNKRFKFLFTMLSESSQNLLMFAVVLFVIFAAFAMAGFLIFSSDVDDYRTFFFSLSNMVRYTVTEMDYSALSQSSRLWGSGYYFLWSLLMLLVLANVFIAILAEAYTRVIDTFDPDSKLGAGLFGLRSAMAKVATVIKSFGAPVRHEDLDADGDGQVSAKELAAKYGLTIEEAKEYISRFDTDGDGQLNMAEFEKVMEEQMKEKERLEKEAEAAALGIGSGSPRAGSARFAGGGGGFGAGVSMKEFNEMKQQVDLMQQLLKATLQQSASGKRALKQLDKGKEENDK